MSREYKKYEFCKSISCEWLINGECKWSGLVYGCSKSAKMFHKWLVSHGFKIIKGETSAIGDRSTY